MPLKAISSWVNLLKFSTENQTPKNYYLVLFQRFLKKQDSRKVSEIEAKAIFK